MVLRFVVIIALTGDLWAADALIPGDTSFTTDHFAGSTNCALCHDGLVDDAGADVSIIRHWAATPMAHASRDPLWRVKMATEAARLPAFKEIIYDKCLTCHAPMGAAEARFQAPEALVAPDGPTGILVPEHPLYDASMEGVGCTLCHQVRADNLGTDESFSGGYVINTDRLIYGPYSEQLFVQPMVNQVNYVPRYSPHISESQLCAVCHELFTPTIDVLSGELTGGKLPEQTPYSEWINSGFNSSDGETCQSCHMPRAAGDLVISTRPPQRLIQRSNFARHEFVGGNTVLSELLDTHKTDLAVSSPALTEQGDKQRTYLNMKTAEIEIVETIFEDPDTFRIRIGVYPHTGHKFPTSFPSRRAYLHVVVKDAATDAVLFESGRTNANGSVDGVDADENAGAFEPHYDIITQPGQVQVYEAVMGNTQGQVTYTLLLGATYLKDNRLLPRGFDKTSAPSHIQVYGAAAADENFLGGSDIVTYEVGGVSEGQSLEVSVDLNYQVMAYGFIQDLLSESDLEDVQRLQPMWTDAATRYETVAHVETTFSSGVRFLRGDGNDDGHIDLSDAVFILLYVFSDTGSADCFDSLDANDDGTINLADAVFVLSYLFAAGDSPSEPFPECGIDPTDDPLDCTVYDSCR